jgi:hypothetical protein
MGRIIFTLMFALSLSGCAQTLAKRLEQTPSSVRYAPSKGDEMASAMLDLAHLLSENGYTVNIVPGLEMAARNGGNAAYGMNYYMVRVIFINGDVPINTQFETLCHEAGHIFESAALNPEISELFAEFVGNGIQRHYGSKTALDTSSAYLAARRHLLVFYPLLQQDINHAIRMLTRKSPWVKSLEQASERGQGLSPLSQD